MSPNLLAVLAPFDPQVEHGGPSTSLKRWLRIDFLQLLRADQGAFDYSQAVGSSREHNRIQELAEDPETTQFKAMNTPRRRERSESVRPQERRNYLSPLFGNA